MRRLKKVSDDHDGNHAHIETPAPFLFCVATAIMFIGLVMATSGGEDKTGDAGYWFVSRKNFQDM